MLTGPADPGQAEPVPEALHRAVSDHGRLLLSNPTRLRAVLSDLLGAAVGAHRQQVETLVAASQCGAAAALADGVSPDDPAVMRQLTAAGLDPDSAGWAVRTVVSALPSGVQGLPAGQSSLHPTSPVVWPDPPIPAPSVPAPSVPALPPVVTHPPAANPRATNPPAANRPSGRPDQGERSAARPDNNATNGRRRLAIGAAAGIVVAAVLGVAGTLLLTRGAPDVAGTVVVTVTSSAVTTTTGGPVSTGVPVTQTVTGSVVATSTVLLAAAPDAAAVTAICEPVADALAVVGRTGSTWAGLANPTVQQAATADEELAGQLSRMDQIVGVAPASASAVPTTVMLMKSKLGAVRAVTALGGTSAYSRDDWNVAQLEFSLEQEGFEDACAVAGGAEPFGTSTATFESACARSWPAARRADDRLTTWLDNRNEANAANAEAGLKAFRAAAAEVRNDIRLAHTMPVRQSVHDLDWWATGLIEVSAENQNPSGSLRDGWDRALRSLDSRC